MNKQKQEAILAQLSKYCASQSMDLKQVHMMMGDKGYGDKSIRELFDNAGLRLSQSEFNETYSVMTEVLKTRENEVKQKKVEEEKENQPKSFDEIRKEQDMISNDNDLLAKVRSSEMHRADYIPEEGSASYTVGPTPEEPPTEEIQLPSQGRFYKGILANQNGKILLRPMTLKEEKILSTERLLKRGQAFDMIFRNCIKTPGIDTTQLLSSDRVFLLFYLRAISYGPEYTVKPKCTSCGHTNETVLNISELTIKYPPEELEEPYFVTLPASGRNITFKLARGYDESQMIKNINAPKMADEVNNVFLERLLNLIIDIKDVPKDKWEVTINNLIGRDISHLRKTLELVDFGYHVDKVISCEQCNATVQVDLTINENFFRSE